MLTQHTSTRAFVFGLIATIALSGGLHLREAHLAAQAAIVKLEPVLIEGKRQQIAQLPLVVVTGHRIA